MGIARDISIPHSLSLFLCSSPTSSYCIVTFIHLYIFVVDVDVALHIHMWAVWPLLSILDFYFMGCFIMCLHSNVICLIFMFCWECEVVGYAHTRIFYGHRVDLWNIHMKFLYRFANFVSCGSMGFCRFSVFHFPLGDVGVNSLRIHVIETFPYATRKSFTFNIYLYLDFINFLHIFYSFTWRYVSLRFVENRFLFEIMTEGEESIEQSRTKQCTHREKKWDIIVSVNCPAGAQWNINCIT